MSKPFVDLRGFRFARGGEAGAQNSQWIRRARSEQGAAMVEMALATVILLAMLFGLMEICLALYTYHYVSEAAREGTRYAIVRGSSCNPGITTPCPAEPADIQNYVENLGYVNPANMTVTTVFSPYPAGAVCLPSAACDNPGNQVQVTVNYQYAVSIPFVPTQTINMSSVSQMVISQ